jgi:hypothetical protein
VISESVLLFVLGLYSLSCSVAARFGASGMAPR